MTEEADQMTDNKDHPRIIEAAKEFNLRPSLLAKCVLAYDRTLEDSLKDTERAVAAAISAALKG